MTSEQQDPSVQPEQALNAVEAEPSMEGEPQAVQSKAINQKRPWFKSMIAKATGLGLSMAAVVAPNNVQAQAKQGPAKSRVQNSMYVEADAALPPVPEEEDVKKKKEEIRGADWYKVKKPTKADLLAIAKGESDLLVRWTLLELAMEAGLLAKAPVADVRDAMEQFALPPGYGLTRQAAILRERLFSRNSKDAESAVPEALALMEDAIDAEQYDLVTNIGNKTALVAKGAERERAVELNQKAGKLKAMLHGVTIARKLLENNPEDPKANMAMGDYFSERGNATLPLQFYEKSGDPALADIAKKLSQKPTDPVAAVDLAKECNAFGKTQQNGRQALFQYHSSVLSKAAVASGKLTGLSKAEAEGLITLNQKVEGKFGGGDSAVVASGVEKMEFKEGVEVDLLENIDVNKMGLRGKFAKVPLENGKHEIVTVTEGVTMLKLPVEVRGNYIVSFVINRTKGEDAIFANLPVAEGEESISHVTSGWNGTKTGWIIGKDNLLDPKTMRSPAKIENGKYIKYEYHVSFNESSRNIVVDYIVNGQLNSRYNGSRDQLGPFNQANIIDPKTGKPIQSPTIILYGGSYKIQKITVTNQKGGQVRYNDKPEEVVKSARVQN